MLVFLSDPPDAGCNPWLPWGLFSLRVIAEPTPGYQPDKCSVTGYIFQCAGPVSKDIVDLCVQGQGDSRDIKKKKWAEICPVSICFDMGLVQV